MSDLDPMQRMAADPLDFILRALAFGERLMEAHLSHFEPRSRPLRPPIDRWDHRGVVVPRDDAPYDLNADACWRCDAAPGETNVGLCAACHTVLKERETT